jgi:two-component system, LytTR family, response regulator
LVFHFLTLNFAEASAKKILQVGIPLLSGKVMLTGQFLEVIERYCQKIGLVALDYLLKPVTFERFLMAINKAGAALSSRNTAGVDEDAAVLIKSGPQTHRVKLSEILYLEKDGNYITVHLKDGNILIRENMGDIFDLVPPADFIRVHKSYVVGIRHISLIEVHQVIVNGEKIPVGSTYRDSLRDRLGIR